MRTETLAKLLMKCGNLFERTAYVRLNGELYIVSHIEHKDDSKTDIIVICKEDDD